MSKSLSDIFSLPDSKRRKFNFIRKSRGKYRKEQRPKRTPAELLEWLKENNIRSSRQVELFRKPGDPTLSDFRREFPKWNDAIDAVFGFRELLPNVNDPEYMAKVVTQLELWTVEAYCAARKNRPDIVPSYFAVKKKWGGFKNLKVIATRYSLLATINSYIALRRRFGRTPTREECQSANVFLDKAIEFYGNKRKLDAFLGKMEKKK